MRCGNAQELMTATVDDELSPRQRRALEAHLAECAACRDELATTEQVLAAVAALPVEAEVPVSLEQETLRRVRIAAAEEAERLAAPRWWWRLRVPAVAATALAALLLVIVGPDEMEQKATPDAPPAVAAKSKETKVVRERTEAPTRAIAGAPAPAPAAVAEAPDTPPNLPTALTERPDLFMDLPILRNLEKLENFEQIETTTLDGQPRSDAAPETRRG
jgi:anti-sigma factor RsiW